MLAAVGLFFLASSSFLAYRKQETVQNNVLPPKTMQRLLVRKGPQIISTRYQYVECLYQLTKMDGGARGNVGVVPVAVYG
jgi:hypothetical protein